MRRTKIYTVTDDNRDKGRQYHLTEMSASQGEWWAVRAFLAMARGGVELPDDFQALGMAGIARLSIEQLGKASPQDAKPLLDELFEQAKFIADPRHPETARFLIEDDIDEIATRLKLKWELVKLHAGFSETVAPSISASAAVPA